MPLAITMAASWLSIYDCAAIAEQIGRNLDLFNVSLRDLPPRRRACAPLSRCRGSCCR
ncbi:MAG: hypothetical protein R2856_38930 [Caldilineaceae bacterium]